ncbi:hypothetical protein RP75_08895 [Agrobacterium arsenijevicii]|uniref:Transposase n=1 Tax=Agrobacterium arsenijevicii TaxID=1585697 RepID=A0ABR5DB40_9HYPH|nr:hypothetical protein RP75_08895 [Agrobacterium arsenijevicii]
MRDPSLPATLLHAVRGDIQHFFNFFLSEPKISRPRMGPAMGLCYIFARITTEKPFTTINWTDS